MLSKKIKSILNQILIVFWILGGGGVLFVLQRNIATAALFSYTVLLIILYRPKIKNVLINAYVYIILLVILCMFVCYLFAVPPQDLTKYAYYLVIFLISGIICIYFFSSFTYSEFLKLFYNGLNIIRIHAIFAALLMPLLLPYSIIINNEISGFEGWTFKYIFYQKTDQFAFSLFGKSIFRNQGLFWEPGVLQFYLNLLLFIQLYVIKSKRNNILITIFTLLTTYSTTAYGCMLIILSIYLLGLIKKKLYAGIFAMVAVAAVIPFFLTNFEQKFQGDKQTSAYVRLYDLTEQVLVIKDYFLTGAGLDDGQYANLRTHYQLSGSLAFLSFNGEERGSSNSLMALLGTVGIFIGGWWLICYTKQQFVPPKKKMLLTIFLLIGVSVEPLLLKPFFVSFIMSGMLFIYIKSKYPQVKSLWKSEF